MLKADLGYRFSEKGMIEELSLVIVGILLICIGVWYFASWMYIVIGIFLVGYAFLMYFVLRRIGHPQRKPELPQ